MLKGNESIYPITTVPIGDRFGLTIRQYFSAMAMQNMAGRMDNKDCAEEAVKIADFLIAELNKEK